MKSTLYDVRIGEREHKVRIDGEGNVSLDGHPQVVDVRATGLTSYSILVNGKSYQFGLEACDGGYTAIIDGVPVIATVDTDRSRLLRQFAATRTQEARVTAIVAPMPALVVRIETHVGQEVAQGQGILVLEAMKMENEIKAPRAGIVKQIHVPKGKAVEKGEVLVTLE